MDPLFEALKDDVWDIRCAAAEALGNIGDKGAVGPLLEALKSYCRHGHIVARHKTESFIEALKKITGQDFGYDYKKWENWYENNKK